MKYTSLSAPEERVDPYVLTPDSRVVDLMPQLIKDGYVPAGISTIIGRRQHPMENVRDVWGKTYLFTGDSSATNDTGAALLTLNTPLLLELNSQSPLVNGALALDRKSAQKKWNELKADKEHSLYLTPDQVADAHEKGYVRKGGVLVPANKVVGKVWDFLNKGKDVKEYAEQVSEASKSDEVLCVYFDLSKPEAPQWRSLVLDRFDYYCGSGVCGNYTLDDGNGRLAGVASGGAAQSVVARSVAPKNGYSPKAAAEEVFHFLATRTLQQGMPSSKELEAIIAKSR